MSKSESKHFAIHVLVVFLLFLVWCPSLSCAREGIRGREVEARLDAFAKRILEARPLVVGYPVNQVTDLKEFYEWYLQSGLYQAAMNNVGDPRKEDAPIKLNTHTFENEVIDYFAPRFGFKKDDYWGFITFSGTDGNSHGMYFGKTVLSAKSNIPPIVYVSEEAHYSIKKLTDVQGLELRLIKATPMGQMDIDDFRTKLDPTRPALVVLAIGTTFKGAIDDQEQINKVLEETPPPAVYRHADAALFGSILAFHDEKAKEIVDAEKMKFDSIAVSGHKFWGLDEPMDIFICTSTVRNQLNPFRVEYLKDAIPTITCSRGAIAPLKFWWKINRTPGSAFEAMAATCLENAKYLHAELTKRKIRSWLNDYSNTVFFQQPSEKLMSKYSLAPEKSELLGDLAHLIVMQHVDQKLLDQFVLDFEEDLTEQGRKHQGDGKGR